MFSKRVWYILHLALLTAGASLLLWPVWVAAESAAVQKSEVLPAAASAKKPVPPKRGTAIGRIAVPRLGMSWVILEGTDSRTLDRSVGHVAGTGLPGEPGNISLAGHRNTHFRKLHSIRRGDKVTISNRNGKFTYLVEWARVFTPEDVQVMDAEHGPAVTLITCYPFRYVGRAPKRFIVRALPDPATRERLLQNAVMAAR